MNDAINFLVNQKTEAINKIAKLIENTVIGKALYAQGGWVKLRSVYSEGECFNPNFGISFLAIHSHCKQYNIDLGDLNTKDNLQAIVDKVNSNLNVNAVEYRIHGLNHYIRIII